MASLARKAKHLRFWNHPRGQSTIGEAFHLPERGMEAANRSHKSANPWTQHQRPFRDHIRNDLVSSGPTDAEALRNIPFRREFFLGAVRPASDLSTAKFRQLKMHAFGHDLGGCGEHERDGWWS